MIQTHCSIQVYKNQEENLTIKTILNLIWFVWLQKHKSRPVSKITWTCSRAQKKCFPTRVLIFDQKWEINLIKRQVSHDMYQRKN